MIEALPALAHKAAAPAGSLVVVVGAGLIALLLSLIVWPVVRFAVTIAHEGGHAITASMMGGTVESIHVYRNNDERGRGITFFRGVGPFGKFFTALAGYTGPSIFGLGGAVLLAGGHSVAVLWLSLVFLLLALIQMGNILGGLAAVGTGAVVILVLRYASTEGRTFFAYVWIWFLLFGGVGHVVASGWRSGDAGELKRLSLLPATIWSGFFGLATLAALVYGAGILLNLVHVGA